MKFWGFIYRHADHETGRWVVDQFLYESAIAAEHAAHAAWDGTSVVWRLTRIPVMEDFDSHDHDAIPTGTECERCGYSIDG